MMAMKASVNGGLLRYFSSRALAGHHSIRQQTTATTSTVPDSHTSRNSTDDTSNNDAICDLPDFEMENPYQEKQRLCLACRHNVQFDYKNVRLLSQFVSSFTGRLYERHITGLCEQQYQKLEYAVNHAIYLAILPSKHKLIEFHKDPKLCDISRPLLSHKHV